MHSVKYCGVSSEKVIITQIL